MNSANNRIEYLRGQLARNGSLFSYGEIEEVFNVLKDVSLKIIVTNVPREVYSNKLAQVYMTNPEAALCARLQTQGWKLPTALLSEHSSQSSTADPGISCFIDHVDVDDNEDSESSANEDYMDEECTCYLSSDERVTSLEKMAERASDPSLTNYRTSPPPVTVFSNDNSVGSQQNRPLECRMETPECENTSEASGDDGNSASITRPHPVDAMCPKHTKRKSRPKMKHLAPPKPSRLYLLSPPASPPVGWEPKPESEPIINYELLEALAALAPGEAFELHPRDQEHRHPSIVITPCEPTHSASPRPQITHTRCPERRS
ncbi:Calcipressin [Paragonimus heterotremus]|uniref:Calcipressin n=1 Tax=Paragonimus heterotremus TaxID=100268 RepID=A0A8J4TGP8_9TREM|nr:Calcipressin [Paragonimus heterotremus]